MSLDLMTAEILPIRFDDDTVVDAARISMAKRASMFSELDNTKLTRYLRANLHWSPFGHQREAFELKINDREFLFFLEHAILAGFTWQREGVEGIALNGSMWAWMENAKWLPVNVSKDVISQLVLLYPRVGSVLWPNYESIPNIGNFAVRIDTTPENATLGNANIHYTQFRLASSIFIARQLVKHQVHLCWNEESRRYIDDPVKYYEGDLRGRGASIKQGSSDELIEGHERWKGIVHDHHLRCDDLYNKLLAAGTAPEIARGVLPLNSITHWVWTGSLPAWARVVKQRLDSHAQKESYHIAKQIDDQMRNRYKGVWDALRAEG